MRNISSRSWENIIQIEERDGNPNKDAPNQRIHPIPTDEYVAIYVDWTSFETEESCQELYKMLLFYKQNNTIFKIRAQ